ncbi:Hypothetical protein SRAE_2000152000 [Strongyloides ratti]|uniref:Uncharacterized protein n=1 Tax=Strongyloides ratti TaxID=34506 RepID=A0A090MYA7_STRRB|nr:Hypothetical protein SRAE_2000152000 [Strongyloides ratti]CEF66854.1 Hypothetical protein SRAE_2000152000 [Strongyloides ratti]
MNIVAKGFTFDHSDEHVDDFIRRMKNNPCDSFEITIFSDSLITGVGTYDLTGRISFNSDRSRKFVKRMIPLFKESDKVRSLKIILTRNFHDNGAIFEVLKNTENNSIVKIQFSIILYEYTRNLTNIGLKIFSGFKNLRIIEILLGSDKNLPMYEYLINCIPNNSRYTLTFILTNYTIFNKDDIHLKLVKLAGTRKIKLGIIDNSYSDARKLLHWLSSLNQNCLQKIVKLHIRAEMYQILNDYLLNVLKMENLESLSCILFGDRGNASDVAFIKRYLRNETGGFTNLHHLKKLKQVRWYHPYPPRSDIVFTQYLNNSSFGFYAFIQTLPSTVESLYVNGVKVMDSIFTEKINFYLPNLVYLHLSQIQYLGRMCLYELKNLKYLIFHDCHVSEIPDSVKALGVFRCKNEGCTNLYNEWIRYIDHIHKFRKIHEYLEHPSGRIFFNDIKDACIISTAFHSL